MLTLLSAYDVQSTLKGWIRTKRKALKLSRQALAEKSTVPASTIKRFETTGDISLRQFLLLWQCVDELARIHDLTIENDQDQKKPPSSIDEVLSEGF